VGLDGIICARERQERINKILHLHKAAIIEGKPKDMKRSKAVYKRDQERCGRHDDTLSNFMDMHNRVAGVAKLIATPILVAKECAFESKNGWLRLMLTNLAPSNILKLGGPRPKNSVHRSNYIIYEEPDNEAYYWIVLNRPLPRQRHQDKECG
jgi:hypothetical protein